MENKIIPPAGSPAPEAPGGEEMVHGFAHRLFDGYDGDNGGREISDERIESLLKGAPPEVLARIAEAKKMAEEAAAPEAEKE